jgi:hypothetical protein
MFLGGFVALVMFAVWRMMATPAPITPVPTSPAAAVPAPLPVAEAKPKPVFDESKLLWESPTAGRPISLAGLPPGTPLILHVRPAKLVGSEEGARVLRALGPASERQLARLTKLTGLELAEIESLLFGVRPGADLAKVDVTLVIRPTKGAVVKVTGQPREHAETKYTLADGRGYWRRGQTWIITAPDTLHEILEAGGEAPLLRRGLERLLAVSDTDHTATLLVAPNFLFADGEAVWSGPLAALRDAAFEELPDELQGLLVSVHVDEQLYVELRGESIADLTATRLVGLLAQRIGGWADKLQLALLADVPVEHSRLVVAKLPAMLQALAAHLRTGVVEDQAVVNAYLPAAAAHNFTLAGELWLSQLAAGRGKAIPPAELIRSQTLAEKLAAPVSLSFDRDTLEMAVSYLADELQTPIEILGSDLQLEGITKNQSFGLAIENRPAAEVLLEICRQANPDKTAQSVADPKQKLVYVVRGDRIVITTRTAAEKRGEKLPEVFNNR